MNNDVELARDYLNNSGRYHVDKGIISIVHDAYEKKVCVCLCTSSRVSSCSVLIVGVGQLFTSQDNGGAGSERVQLDKVGELLKKKLIFILCNCTD